MAESLCDTCAISAARVLRRTSAGTIAVPADTVRPGHIMVVSATHAASFSDLSAEQASAFMSLVGAAARAAEQASGAERYYVIRIGDKAPHLHFHLVPRVAGEDSLAPFVFGETGWASRTRADATPPVELFDEAFTGIVRFDAAPDRTPADVGRLPPGLVKLGMSMTALSAVLLIGIPAIGANWAGPLALGAATAAGEAADDRMKARPVRWGRSFLTGLMTGAVFLFLSRWLFAR